MTANDLNCRSRRPLSSSPSASVAWLTRLPARVLSEIKMHYEYAIKITYTQCMQRNAQTNNWRAAMRCATAFYACHALSFNISCAQNAALPAAQQDVAAWGSLAARPGSFWFRNAKGAGAGGQPLIGDWLQIAKRTETEVNWSVAATSISI